MGGNVVVFCLEGRLQAAVCYNFTKNKLGVGMAAERFDSSSEKMSNEELAKVIHDELVELLPIIQAGTSFSTRLPRVFNMFVQSRMKTDPKMVEFLEDFSSSLYAFLSQDDDFVREKSSLQQTYELAKTRDKIRSRINPKILKRMEEFIYQVMDETFYTYLVDHPDLLQFFDQNMADLYDINNKWNDYLFFRAQVDNTLITQASQGDVGRLMKYNRIIYNDMLNNLTEHRDFLADQSIDITTKILILFPKSTMMSPSDTETNEATTRVKKIAENLEAFCHNNADKDNKAFRKEARKILLAYEAGLVDHGKELAAGYLSLTDKKQYMQRFDKGSIPMAGGVFTGVGHFLHVMQFNKLDLDRVSAQKSTLAVIQLAKFHVLPPKIEKQLEKMPKLAKIKARSILDLDLTDEQYRQADQIAQKIKPMLSTMHAQLHTLKQELSGMKDTSWGGFFRNTKDLSFLSTVVTNLPHISSGGDWYVRTAQLHKIVLDQMAQMRTVTQDPRDIAFFDKHLKAMTKMHLPDKPQQVPKTPRRG